MVQVTGCGSVPTFPGPASQLGLACVGGCDQGEAVGRGETCITELVTKVGNDLLILRIVSELVQGIDMQRKLGKLCV